MSYTSIQTFLEDVFSLPLSTGQIAKIIQKVACIEPEPLGIAGGAATTAGDEHRRDGASRKRATHVDVGLPRAGRGGFTWFHVDPSRSTEVLYEFLGETFSGIIGCDYYGVYRKFLDETDAVMQFCWAHLIRDVKFLTTLSDPVTRRYGEKLLVKIKGLFRVWHRRGQMPAEKWQRAARRAQEAVLQRAKRAPPRSRPRTSPSGSVTTARITSRS